MTQDELIQSPGAAARGSDFGSTGLREAVPDGARFALGLDTIALSALLARFWCALPAFLRLLSHIRFSFLNMSIRQEVSGQSATRKTARTQ
ncbi:hypothetical protein [Herbaspirillum lusitanum]|uniref:hypothetical protein n=1 Tax=Herbaspirillum lusitanum TaxID=213312 RepID=UPI00138A3EB3|nr:hypothetical protein [Herbaspirillum lusitanum]